MALQATEASWIVVSNFGWDKSRASASRCVRRRRMVVYILMYESINKICQDRLEIERTAWGSILNRMAKTWAEEWLTDTKNGPKCRITRREDATQDDEGNVCCGLHSPIA